MTATTGSDEQEIILKTDCLGRVTVPTHRREFILDQYERSGMSGQGFARHIGVKYTTFASWVQKRKRARGQYPGSESKPANSLTLLEAVCDTQAQRARVSAHLSPIRL